MSDLTSLAGSINKMGSSLQKLGVDVRALQVTGAAFQAIGGTGQIIKGIIAAKQAYNAFRLAEGMAHLAKYTLWAGGVAALAVAGGAAMGMMIEKAISTDDTGTGMRGLAGGYTNGRY